MPCCERSLSEKLRTYLLAHIFSQKFITADYNLMNTNKVMLFIPKR